MGALVLVIALGVIAILVVRAFSQRGRSHVPPTPEVPGLRVTFGTHLERVAGGPAWSGPLWDKHRAWLMERWNRARTTKESGGRSREFPAWYFDESTDRQIDRLARSGLKLKREGLLKGEASGLIGLMEEPSDEDIEVLKFFKSATRDMNQTTARAEVAHLIADPQNKHRWETRPASKEQRDCIKFFATEVPKDMTHVDADALIDELSEANPDRASEWSNLIDIFWEFSDPDFRETVEIKRPSRQLIQQAIDELIAEGKSLATLEAEAVADRIISKQPDLHHSYDN